MRDELHSLLSNLSRSQEAEIQKLILSCDCPSKISSPDLSTAIDEYQKILNTLNHSERIKVENDETTNKKIIEVHNKSALNDIHHISNYVMHCDLGFPDFYPSNTSYCNEKKNSCLNLEMDLVDQEAKILRNEKVIEVLKLKGFPCIIRACQSLEAHMSKLKSDEKKVVEEFLKILLKHKQAYNDHMNVLEVNQGKLESVSEKIKKIHHENCKCKEK